MQILGPASLQVWNFENVAPLQVYKFENVAPLQVYKLKMCSLPLPHESLEIWHYLRQT